MIRTVYRITYAFLLSICLPGIGVPADDGELIITEIYDSSSMHAQRQTVLDTSPVLTSDYTLGRLPRSVLAENVVGWGMAGENSAGMGMLSYRGGSGTDKVSFGIVPGFTVIDPVHGATIFQVLPYLDFQWQVAESNQFRISFSPTNFFFVVGGSGQSYSGFELPFLMINSYEWGLLSKKGRIRLHSDDYDWAFLFGPLLNQGQIRSRLRCRHTIHGNNASLKMFDIALLPSGGLTDRLQLDLHGAYSVQVDDVADNYLSADNNERIRIDSVSTGCGLRLFRNHSFWQPYCGVDLLFGEDTRTIYPSDPLFYPSRYNPGVDDWQLSRYIGDFTFAHLLGDRITSPQQVDGNWNRFFSRFLGHRQLLNTLSLHTIPWELNKKTYEFTGADGISDSTTSITIKTGHAEIKQNLRIGFLDRFEIGQHFNVFVSDTMQPVFHLGAHLSLFNLRLRSYGPNEADDQEYFFGIRLNRGQFYGTLHASFTLPRKEVPYHWKPISEYSPTGSPGGLEMADPLARVDNNNVMQYSTLNTLGIQDLLNNRFISFLFSWGITDIVTVTDRFEYNRILFDPLLYAGDSNYPSYSPYDPENVHTPEANSIFSNLLFFTLHIQQNRRISLVANFAAQTDGDGGSYKQEESTNFAFLLLFQSAIGR